MIELVEKVTGSGDADDSLTLPFELRQKCRQRVLLDSGREAAVLLPRGNSLLRGDRLVAADGTQVRVDVAKEPVSTGRTRDRLLLARACYHLGNRHVALQIGPDFVRYQPDHVLDDMLRKLGLGVERELAGFEPEGGAYGGHAHAHLHADHGHEHQDHDHEPAGCRT